jgi:integrase
MIIVGRPPLSVGTYGSISTSPYGTGYRARTLYRDYDGVTRRVERHGQTKGAAERALRLALRDRAYVGVEAEITPDTKIAGLAETWFAEISAQDRSPGTLRAYRDRLDRQIIPALGNLRVRELTTGVVDRHLRAVRDKHGASLAKLCRTVLSGMAGLATRHDALEHNPVRDAGRISPGKPKRVPRALSVAETRQLRAWLSNDDKARERDLPDLVDLMDQNGLSPRAAADQLGHSHPSLTQDVYYGRRIANTGAADVLEVFG